MIELKNYEEAETICNVCKYADLKEDKVICTILSCKCSVRSSSYCKLGVWKIKPVEVLENIPENKRISLSKINFE